MLALMPRRARIGFAAAAVALTALAGCGDDGPEQVSAEELVSMGDEACAEGRARFAEIQAQPLRNANEAADQTRELIEAADDELNELRDLVPPEELEEPYNAYLEARVRAIEVFRQGLDAAEQDDDQAYVDAQARASAGAAKREELARAVGFSVCSSSG
jgi:hypothetical protein